MSSEVEVGMHWLTSASALPVRDVFKRVPGGFGPVEKKGQFFQPMSRLHESGARVFFGSENKAQPVVLNVPGEVCESGWAQEALGWTQAIEGRVTRLDVALDLGPPEKARRRLVEMHRAWERGQVQTRMSPGSHKMHTNSKHNPTEGYTAYFGSGSSALMLRAYDRRGPLRLEWQFRPGGKELQRSLPEIALRQGMAPIWRALSSAAMFPMSWYLDLVEGERAMLKEARSEIDGAELAEAIETVKRQFGRTLWAFVQLGVKMEDVIEAPPEKVPGRDLVKWNRWASGAARLGYDGAKLDREVRCRLK